MSQNEAPGFSVDPDLFDPEDAVAEHASSISEYVTRRPSLPLDDYFSSTDSPASTAFIPEPIAEQAEGVDTSQKSKTSGGEARGATPRKRGRGANKPSGKGSRGRSKKGAKTTRTSDEPAILNGQIQTTLFPSALIDRSPGAGSEGVGERPIVQNEEQFVGADVVKEEMSQANSIVDSATDQQLSANAGTSHDALIHSDSPATTIATDDAGHGENLSSASKPVAEEAREEPTVNNGATRTSKRVREKLEAQAGKSEKAAEQGEVEDVAGGDQPADPPVASVVSVQQTVPEICSEVSETTKTRKRKRGGKGQSTSPLANKDASAPGIVNSSPTTTMLLEPVEETTQPPADMNGVPMENARTDHHPLPTTVQKDNDLPTKPVHPFFTNPRKLNAKAPPSDTASNIESSLTPASASDPSTPIPSDPSQPDSKPLPLLDTHAFFLTPAQKREQKQLQKQTDLRKEMEASKLMSQQFSKGKKENPFFQKRNYAGGEMGLRNQSFGSLGCEVEWPSRWNCHVGRVEEVEGVESGVGTVRGVSHRMAYASDDIDDGNRSQRLDSWLRSISSARASSDDDDSKPTRSPDAATAANWREEAIRNLNTLYPAEILNAPSHAYIRNKLNEPNDSRVSTSSDLWTERYTPTNASQTLGAANAGVASFITSWLEGWKIAPSNTTTDTESDGRARKRKGRRPRDGRVSKKSKRKGGLDDFIVSDEDYGGDGSGAWSESSSTSSSADATGADITRHLMLMGPSGVGKTALVYAVAAQCGYEVLEVNCSMRRSGKDLTSGVWEATQSHAVGKGGGGAGLKEVGGVKGLFKGGEGAKGSGSEIGMESDGAGSDAPRPVGKRKRRRVSPTTSEAEGTAGEEVARAKDDEMSQTNTTSKRKGRSKRKHEKVENPPPVEVVDVVADDEMNEELAPRPRRSSRKKLTASSVVVEEEPIVDVVGDEDQGKEPSPVLESPPESPRITIRLKTAGYFRNQRRQKDEGAGDVDKMPVEAGPSRPQGMEVAVEVPARGEVVGASSSGNSTVTSVVPQPARKTLILLDEVDVMSEHDKGFWSGVAGLIEKSKRPIVFTCNDDPFTLSNPAMPPNLLSLFFEYTTRLPMVPPTVEELQSYLHVVMLKEGKRVDVDALRHFCWECRGDVRKALLGCMVGRGQMGGLVDGRGGEGCSGGEVVIEDSDAVMESVDICSKMDAMKAWAQRLEFMTDEPEDVKLDGEANVVYYAGVNVGPPVLSTLGWAGRAGVATDMVEEVAERYMRMCKEDAGSRRWVADGDELQDGIDRWRIATIRRRFALLSGLVSPGNVALRPRVFEADVYPYVGVMCRLDKADRSADGEGGLEERGRGGRRKGRKERRYFEEVLTAEGAELIAGEWDKMPVLANVGYHSNENVVGMGTPMVTADVPQVVIE
ncbi:ATPase AAA domain-containing protein 5 [Rhizophlyctis rosea]|nr:ATPase AAA domain-containing protein 5 [Rhizophlyctis rosea]